MENLYSLSLSSKMDHDLISRHSLSEEKLIDNAAKGAFDLFLPHVENKRVLFLVGKGNNGSDALEMARLSLSVSKEVFVLLLFDGGNQENMRRRALLPSSLFVSSIPEDIDTVVDGVFGFSFRGTMDERLDSIFKTIDSSPFYKIALDVPSGFGYKADATVSFMCRKREMYYPDNRRKCGDIFYFNPGFSEEEYYESDTFLLSDDDYSVPSFSSSDYKNTRGHLLIAGGSKRYPGAPILSSLSAFHAGVGLVSLCSDKSVLDRVFSSYPSIMGVEKGSIDRVKSNAFLLGPGWDEGDREIIEYAKSSNKGIVIDADAIKLIRKDDDFSSKAVITPHYGEFRTLLRNLEVEEGDFLEKCRVVSDRLDAVLVVKTSVVWIVYRDKSYVYDGSNPSLGVAGSGDVLSGIISAFLSSGLSALESAINGVILHQRCGKKLSESLGFYTSEDLIREVGKKR